MKILVLPFDIASKGPLTLDALNKIEGIEAKGIFVNGFDNRRSKSQHAHHLEQVSFKTNPIGWTTNYFRKSNQIQKLIKWADVLHWIWDSAFAGGWDLRLASVLKKPGIIEWSGSDIRYPEKNFEINPYAELLYTRDYEFKDIETREISFRRQEKFSKLGFTPLVTPEMDLYIRKDLFPKTFLTLHRLNVRDFKVTALNNPRPVVVHSPTRRFAKGTKYVLEAVEALKKDFDFEFILLERVARQKALEVVQHCDIFIDQLLLGSNGMASCEAMSMGKSVLCHMMQPVYDNGLPAECPVISTNPDNIKQNLATLLADPDLRRVKGAAGRAYAEKYLDVDKTALELVKYYQEVLEKRKTSQKDYSN